MNAPQWDNGGACGQCVVARCIDSQCVTQNVGVLVMIVDKCPECLEGALDFSYPAYTAITGRSPNRLKVSWQYADCAAFVDGTIQYNPKSGSNGYWQAFFLSNYKYPLASVALNGAVLERSQFQFFQNYGSAPSGAFTLTLTATNGQVITATVNDISTAQDLGVQFSG